MENTAVRRYSSFMTLDEFEKEVFETAVLHGGEGRWFLDLVRHIQYLQTQQNLKITDVYIHERKPISVGILKTFLPLPAGNNKEIARINTPEFVNFDRIWKLVQSLYTKRLIQVGYQPNKAYSIAEDHMINKNVISFSFAVQDIGVMRYTFSKSQSGLILTFRLLPFVAPSLKATRLDRTPIPYLLNTLSSNIEQRIGENVAILKTFDKGGIIIHCGATGSGKSTSIASQIQHIAMNSAGIIITYEDPVEYRFIFPNVIQYEIPNNIKYEEIYHHFLRSTAQVCLIGEIRTREMLIQALDIANRGHLVYTTFHANSVVEAIYTIKSIVGEEYYGLLLNALRGVVYQKLKMVGQEITPLYEMLLMPEDQNDEARNYMNTIKTIIEKETSAALSSYIKDNIKSLRQHNIYWTNME